METRETILNSLHNSISIRSNLRTSASGVDENIKASIKSITPRDRKGLWQQFENELKKISGEYYSFPTQTKAEEFISGLLKELKIPQVCADGTNAANSMLKKLEKRGIKLAEYKDKSAEEKKKILSQINAAIVSPSYAVADIGSLVFLTDDTGTTYPHFLCDNTIALIKKDQITANQFELFEVLDPEKAKNMFFVTGPSRTADIEKVLVLGAHGPRRLIVVCIDK